MTNIFWNQKMQITCFLEKNTRGNDSSAAGILKKKYIAKVFCDKNCDYKRHLCCIYIKNIIVSFTIIFNCPKTLVTWSRWNYWHIPLLSRGNRKNSSGTLLWIPECRLYDYHVSKLGYSITGYLKRLLGSGL